MIEWLQRIIQDNQFIQGGIAVSIGAAAWSYARNVPGRIISFIRARLFIDFEVPQYDPAFKWTDAWLAEHPSIQYWSRWFTVTTVEAEEDDATESIILSPAPGNHWIWWRGWPIWVYRSRRELTMANDYKANFETYNITMWAWGRSGVEDLLAEVKKYADEKVGNLVRLYEADCWSWSNDSDVPPRPIESVVLEAGVLERITEHCEKFLANRDRFLALGIPHRTGILLFGDPGNGKSSVAMAVASHFKLNLCRLSLSEDMSDDRINRLMHRLPKRALLLIEDVDCVVDGRKPTKSKLTFAGLLNALDGVGSGEGRILFMTTNKVKELDPALIRDGRCDLKEEIKNATAEQATRLFLRFFPGSPLASEFGYRAAGVPMASLQTHLTKNIFSETQAAKFDKFLLPAIDKPLSTE